MRLSTYRFALHTKNIYTFVSTGMKGQINKAVMFEEVEPDQYNLAMGDIDDAGLVSDTVQSGNNDARKIFATTAEIVDAYTKLYPEIIFKGNTLAKEHIYSRLTSGFLDEIELTFLVTGVDEAGNLEPFQKDKIYHAILVKRK